VRGTCAAIAAVVAGFVVVLVSTGVGLLTVCAWVATVAATTLAGGLVVRAARRHPAALADDLAWGLPTGLLLAMGGWLAGQLLGVHLPAVPFMALLCLLVLAVPPWRRRAMVRPGDSWGRGSGAVVTGSLLVSLIWMRALGLASLPVTPPPGGYFYNADFMFQSAMTAELGRTLRPTYPMIAGDPGSYHWFVYAVASFLGQGFDTGVLIMRLVPVTLVLALVLLCASVARQISGRTSAAGFGAVLVGVVGATVANRWMLPTGIAGRYDTDGAVIDPIGVYWQVSPTQTLAWVAGVACLGAVVATLRSTERRPLVPMVGVVAFAALSAGAKSSELPVLLAGFGLGLLVSLLARRATEARRLAGICLAVGLLAWLATVVIYPGGSYGLVIRPGQRLELVAQRFMPGLAQTVGPAGAHTTRLPLLAILAGVVLTLLPLLPRLLGLLVLMRSKPQDPVPWIGAGVAFGGLAATMMTRHPAQSELYFFISAYPIALPVSAAGFAILWDRLTPFLRREHRLGLSLLAAAGGGLVACWAISDALGSSLPIVAWVKQFGHAPKAQEVSALTQALAWSRPVLLTALACAVIALLGLVVTWGARRRSPIRPATWTAALLAAALLGGGAFATVLHVRRGDGLSPQQAIAAWTKDNRNVRAHVLTTQDYVSAAAAIRDHAHPDDVVATNMVCLVRASARKSGAICDPRDFSASAYTGLRSDVAGWAYTQHALGLGWVTRGGYIMVPYWDPARLAAERALIEAPTRTALDAAYRRGVRWILADRQSGAVSPLLDQLAVRVYDRGGAYAYRLLRPA
jgi:hypothetical protein